MNLDPGLQQHRTALSWRRTALTATVVLMLLLHTVAVSGAPQNQWGVLLAVANVAVLTLLSIYRSRQLHRSVDVAGRWIPATIVLIFALLACQQIVAIF